jgi:hypothetical protein
VSDTAAQRDFAAPPVPASIRLAAGLVMVEAGALLGAAVILTVLAFVHSTTRLWAAIAIVGFVLLAAAVLGLCARGLLRLRPSARSPIVLAQVLALPVSFSLGFQGGRLAIALPILLVAIAVLVLLFAPSARTSLDRTL